ncbi:winged helix-turn-helix domain-containing protein [Streptomyces sp. PU_AKi4]|uniref:helix-turn-helix domain-containing protein n=1 Tax=Streptomyces sp. PU_AKi4 TaxID=2800809 RepID=UPI0035258B01
MDVVDAQDADRPAVPCFDTVEGTWLLLKRHGWSRQQPARWAIERDDEVVDLWKKEVWPRVEERPRSGVRGSPSRTRRDSR